MASIYHVRPPASVADSRDMLRIYGTRTSPYVRRVRILAHELGVEYSLVDTADPEGPGQSALRERCPVWKVPTAEFLTSPDDPAGELVFDSHLISELLMLRHGPGQLAPLAPEDIVGRNAITVIDGAMDGLINRLYLGRDGLPLDHGYLQKHADRAASAMAWLATHVEDGWLTPQRQLGLPEIALATTLAWMRFRGAYPIERHPELLVTLERLEARESFSRTAPDA
ncbi:glutathione S-transferase N-terminal domain-containing protein [Pseudenhygromyxa sp. WMMC2535]|uniref:glutathione S-transferase family protein n=1 Tax=Pseudenhygromyxa sp. WMMC2535 TaxID=2712867 RepID=UPI0015959C08|nr:glutathione S-transferase N-terminal domain-containing protein [Pseudenhygromyxa sp. WMMC2535]NVB42731.1 glutathione S-transferase N-terminal domain-containing protein [Pseudenhygromyxa sp. WMMC2535]